MNEIIHAVVGGQALCRFTVRRPAVFPPGHLALEADSITEVDVGLVDCEACLRALTQRLMEV